MKTTNCVRWILTGALALAITGCEQKPQQSTPELEPSSAKASTKPERDRGDDRHLDVIAARVVLQITELESKKDVTCWTSFRQLDSFIASKQYSDFATLTKIGVIKHLVRAIWIAASGQDGKVDPEVLAGALAKLDSAALSDGLDKDALGTLARDIGMRDYNDYRKTSEHWRVLLSIVQDEIVVGKNRLGDMGPAQLEQLADLTTRLSLALLRESGAVATTMRSPMIEGEHVREAYKTIVERYDLGGFVKEAPAAAAPEEGLDAEQIAKRIAPMTRAMIEGKVTALRAYNKEANPLAAIQRVSRMPIDEDAYKLWASYLKSFVVFVSSGFEPMRGDNYLSDGSFARAKLPKRRYLDAVWTENVVMQVFPHVMMPNGDIKLRFEPNPGTVSEVARAPFDLLMLDYEQNGVRDSAIHWIAMQAVWQERAFAMDPFAAEYLSEVVSMMMTYFVRRAEMIARAEGKTRIDASIARRVRDPLYTQVLPVEVEGAEWSDEQKALKEKELRAYKGAFFKDVTSESGLPVEVTRIDGALSDAGLRADIQRVMGSGVGVGDVNGDGYPDLFIAGEGLGRLYLNKGARAPGAFEDVTARYGIPAALHDSRAALFFDKDGDGDLDLLIVRSGNPSLLLELDKGRYTDRAGASGIKTTNGAHSASVFDYDLDGDLDILIGYYGSDVVNKEASQERNLPSIDGRNSTPAQLWRREADGTYSEVAAQARIANTGWTLAVSSFDYDRDGDLDVYMANDFGANSFYENLGDGTFADVSLKTNTADRGSGMNVSVTDVNEDGRFDFYITNIDMFSKSVKIVFPSDESLIPLGDEVLRSFQYITGNKMYVSAPEADAKFASMERELFEPGDRGWAWDGNFFDYDLDGDEDLYIANGWIEGSYASGQKNQLFVKGGDHFFHATDEEGASFAGNSRAVASVDVDRDGDLDLVVTNFRAAPKLLRNVQAMGHNAITLELHGDAANTDAIGAVIEIEAGGKRQLRQVSVGRGYLSQDEPGRLVIGVGQAEEARVTVYMPGRAKPLRAKARAGEVTVIGQQNVKR